MPTLAQIAVTEGSGKNVATYEVTESTVTKELQRITPSDSSGNEILPFQRPSLSVTQGSISITGTGDNFVVNGVGGQTINIYKIIFVVNTPTNINMYSGSASQARNLMGSVINFSASGGFSYDGDHFPITLTTGDGFNLNLSGTAQVSGRLWYTQG